MKKNQRKEFENLLKRIYGIELPANIVLLKRNDYVYAVNKSVLEFLENFSGRIERIGLKIATWDKTGIRLSIEGIQFFGREAKKNVVKIKDSEKFMAGIDVEFEGNPDYHYVIVKNNREFLGPGKIIKNNMVRPYIGKDRRIPSKYVGDNIGKNEDGNIA